MADKLTTWQSCLGVKRFRVGNKLCWFSRQNRILGDDKHVTVVGYRYRKDLSEGYRPNGAFLEVYSTDKDDIYPVSESEFCALVESGGQNGKLPDKELTNG